MTVHTSHSSPSGARVRAEKIHDFFSGIAGIYDFFNHFFSAGIDLWWRHVLFKEIIRQRHRFVLDLATGSGDVAKLLLGKNIQVIGADFCFPMLVQAGKKRIPLLLNADAQSLPLADGVFDAVTIAFGFRNFTDRKQSLSEIRRVLKPGGCLYILEFSTPYRLLRPLYFLYLGKVMPLLTEIFFKQGQAYRHLNDSIRSFPNQVELCEELDKAGFCEISYRNLTFGISALHIAQKKHLKLGKNSFHQID